VEPLRDHEPLTALLARRARDGDLERFGQLCERLMPALTSWAALRISGSLRGKLEPEDVVQESWVRALAAFESFDERRSSFRGWMFGIAKNVLLEGLRSSRRPGRSADPASALSGIPDTVTTISRSLARDEVLLKFREHVAGLEREDRELVLMCGLEGATARESAVRLSITEEAAKKRWQRLRADLARHPLPRACLNEE
jgi:RNA polymerase sigma factor (sigma-70 family)